MSVADADALRRARDAIEQGGWEAATMERLAAALGVSRMTLHRRGVRREHVLAALGELLQEDYRRALWPALTAPGSGRERLATALDGLCTVTEQNLALLAALDSAERDEIFHERATGGVLTNALFTEPLRALLRDGIADGTLAIEQDETVDEVATVLFNLLSWTYRHLRLAHRWPARRAAEAVTRRAVRSVAA
ncbi:TetR family transcriptional regulator [Conexibacter stalactiti]|uniref:TetR family transcriptional regulator n=1 Tax=Conexibacter stalactiti TaxID=1940611 RepID=A0ABU4HM93_9ACTN|nr:TetR family transcriptional regulator [Conexibacter stalactiti]MDW5594416.1 TetR family transcriptional regulator [Conexibacter stalactiti]MEC5035058.1 TetR family transcriptional regulator [Conexibacter stalactiti]